MSEIRLKKQTDGTTTTPPTDYVAFYKDTSTSTMKIKDDTGAVYSLSGGVSDHTLLTNIGTNTHAQIDTHIANTSNPHSVTKSQVGLANVDNTSDANKPVSTAQQTAIDAKVSDAINNGTTTIAPSQNAVYDALALKEDLSNKITSISGSSSTLYPSEGAVVNFFLSQPAPTLNAVVASGDTTSSIINVGGVTTESSGYGANFNKSSAGYWTNSILAGGVSEARTYADDITDIRSHDLPDADGRYVLSVNGTAPSTAGDVSLDISLQESTDAGNTTTNSITVNSIETAQTSRFSSGSATAPAITLIRDNPGGLKQADINPKNLTDLRFHDLPDADGTYVLSVNGTPADSAGNVTISGGGITSLGAQTGATQTFATGTSGTDFAISSSSDVHTFNIPTASASNTGKLSSSDWSTFNGKEEALTFSTGLTRSTNTITSNLSTGISGGQSVVGGTASGNNLTLSSTSNATKGKVILGSASAYDEVNDRLGIGQTTPTTALDVVGASLTGAQTTGSVNVAQTWNTSGSPTMIKANATNTASGASTLLMDLQVGGVTQFNVSKGGALTLTGAISTTANASINSLLASTSVRCGATGIHYWNTRSQMASPSDGVIQFANGAGTGFGRLQLGGSTSSFPSIKRSGAYIAMRLADDSADASTTMASLTLSGSQNVPKTITAGGTTGAQTINKMAGSVNFAAAASTLVVTNSLVDANSIVIVQVHGTDATFTSARVTLASGSFTITADVAATAETRVSFLVIN